MPQKIVLNVTLGQHATILEALRLYAQQTPGFQEVNSLHEELSFASTDFASSIQKFNAMYKLPLSPVPTLDVGVPALQRLKDFKDILNEELAEIDDIIAMLAEVPAIDSVKYRAVLTAIADLLGDIQVYCASEMAKFGLPLNETLSVIMASNFSKEFSDGPHYDERGKVLKGPGYWKPEPILLSMVCRVLTAHGIPLIK